MVSRAEPLNEQDLRDLGFGAVVSRESHQRLLNRDGSFNVERKGLTLVESISPYHLLLTMPWWQFFALCFVRLIRLRISQTLVGHFQNPIGPSLHF